MNIYLITNTVNQKRYVGKTQKTIQARWKYHLREARYGSETHLHRAVRKYGVESFVVEPIDTAISVKELNEKERHWIAEYKTMEFGYNMTPGGEGTGHRHSPETIEKLRRAATNRTMEQRERYRQAQLGRTYAYKKRPSMVGNQNSKGMTYFHSESAKVAIGNANRGKVLSSKTRQKISEARSRCWTGQRNAH